MRLAQRIQAFLWVASAFAVAYTAWVFTGRLFEHKRLDQRAERKTTGPANPEFDRIYGGKGVDILEFYAREGDVAPGHSTLLCYGVVNASGLRMEPAVDGIRPALNRCVEVGPSKTTTYTLTAEGAGGTTISKAVTIVVR